MHGRGHFNQTLLLRQPRIPSAAAKHLDDFGHNLKVSFVSAGQDDRLELGVDRVQAEFCVTPRISIGRFLAPVSLDRVPLTALRVGIVALAAFLAVFTAPDFEFGQFPETDCAGAIWPFDFSPQAEELLDTCHRSGWVQVFDWMSWADTLEAQFLRTDSQALNRATPERLSRLLTALIRGERFCDGTLNEAFESGLLTGILHRASALAKSEHRDGDVA